MLLDNGVKAMLKVLEAYMGEAGFLTDLGRCITTWPLQALAQHEGKVAKYASGCCSVAPAST